MFADIDHGFCFKPLYHIGVSKNISITFLREKGNGRTMQLVAVIYFRILKKSTVIVGRFYHTNIGADLCVLEMKSFLLINATIIRAKEK